jgi:hypothetical protein
MPLHDYRCLAHGVFESFDGKCPSGCDASLVEKVFLKPAGFHTARTVNIDKTLDQLALDFNMTDMNNQNGTSAAARPDPKKIKERQEQLDRMTHENNQLMGKLGDTAQAWGQIPGGNSGVNQALAQARAVGDNALAPILPSLTAPKPKVVARHDAEIKV